MNASALLAIDLDELLLLNDFEALAWSLPQLRADELRRVGGGRAHPRGLRAVIGPGTGLGVSGLIPCRGGWAAVRGEGGHVSFSPADERESALVACVWKDFPHVSAERLVSGIGLPMLHRAASTSAAASCRSSARRWSARRFASASNRRAVCTAQRGDSNLGDSGRDAGLGGGGSSAAGHGRGAQCANDHPRRIAPAALVPSPSGRGLG